GRVLVLANLDGPCALADRDPGERRRIASFEPALRLGEHRPGDRERRAQDCAQPHPPGGAACLADRRTSLMGWRHAVPVSAARFAQAPASVLIGPEYVESVISAPQVRSP